MPEKKKIPYNSREKRAEEEKNVRENLKKFWKGRKKVVSCYKDKIAEPPEELANVQPRLSPFSKEIQADCVLLITANPVETNIVTRLLAKESKGEMKTFVTSGSEHYLYNVGRIHKTPVVHFIQGTTGSDSPKASRDVLEEALKTFDPRLVVSLGVAFGIDSKKTRAGRCIGFERSLHLW